jgi:hypothetical protein
MVIQDIAKLGVYSVIDGKSHRGRHMGRLNALLHPLGTLHGRE